MKIDAFLTQLCQHSGLDGEGIEVMLDEKDDHILITLKVPAEESGLMIGSKGETLTSIQRILRVIFSSDYEDKRLIFNINDYRERRRQTVEEMASDAAQRVLETGRTTAISQYLPSYERYLAHSFISEQEEYQALETFSEGDGRSRRVVVGLKAEPGWTDSSKAEEAGSSQGVGTAGDDDDSATVGAGADDSAKKKKKTTKKKEVKPKTLSKTGATKSAREAKQPQEDQPEPSDE